MRTLPRIESNLLDEETETWCATGREKAIRGGTLVDGRPSTFRRVPLPSTEDAGRAKASNARYVPRKAARDYFAEELLILGTQEGERE